MPKSNKPDGTSLRDTNKVADLMKTHEENNPRSDDQWLQTAKDRANIDKDKKKTGGSGSYHWVG